MSTLPLTDEQIEEVAVELIEDHATDIEYLSISEFLADKVAMHSATEDEFDKVARKVSDLIRTATVTVELTR